MEDHKLRAFCLVVEMKSFSKAAEAKSMSQSAISHLIKNLEDEIGAKLLVRKGKTIIPTKAGKTFYEHAVTLLRQYKKMEDDIYSLMQRIKGPLHIGSSETAAGCLLPQAIYSFAKNYPDVEIHVSVSNSEDIIRGILEANFDIGIIDEKIKSKSVFAIEIAEDEIVAIASEGNTLTQKKDLKPTNLVSQNFILPEAGSGIREFIDDYLTSIGIDLQKINISMTLGNPELIIQMVKSGLGISFVSKWSAFKAIQEESVKLLPIDGKKLQKSFSIIWLKQEDPRLVMKTFIEFMRNYRFFKPF